jgi:hypothetical protein
MAQSTKLYARPGLLKIPTISNGGKSMDSSRFPRVPSFHDIFRPLLHVAGIIIRPFPNNCG